MSTIITTMITNIIIVVIAVVGRVVAIIDVVFIIAGVVPLTNVIVRSLQSGRRVASLASVGAAPR